MIGWTVEMGLRELRMIFSSIGKTVQGLGTCVEASLRVWHCMRVTKIIEYCSNSNRYVRGQKREETKDLACTLAKLGKGAASDLIPLAMLSTFIHFVHRHKR